MINILVADYMAQFFQVYAHYSRLIVPPFLLKHHSLDDKLCHFIYRSVVLELKGRSDYRLVGLVELELGL